ncbi:hypothetical protein FGO68_gene11720 [Halteria grandinella]|uniref:J domain-containing protein n=1 Tax=Halteria grandinella TaxID=5974 RepID=A0A8J8NB49_HALGN|nr:hypothetical protein FGO68_gene11720 [Halteria grandinella]
MNYYELLEVDEKCSNEIIKKAFLQKIRQCHPDKQGEAKKASELIEAYKVLTNFRVQYDETLKQQFKQCFDKLIVTCNTVKYQCEQCGEENEIDLDEQINIIVECTGCNLRLQIYQQ